MSQSPHAAGLAGPPRLPLLPLHSVLFPGGTLALRVFEPRYLSLASECLRQESTFGICLITGDAESGAPVHPRRVGVEARIVAGDMTRPGTLALTVRGLERFRVLAQVTDAQGLIRADVAPLAAAPRVAVPRRLAALVPLLQAMVADAGAVRLPPPHDFADASWVGYRFCELLPIPAAARQKLLELDDPVSRLEIVFKFLSQRALV